MAKEKAIKKDTRIALDAGNYEIMRANSTDVELFESMFRVKGVRNVQYMNNEQVITYNQARELCSGIGDIVAEDGTKFVVGVYCKKA